MQKEILVSENPIVREASEGVVLRVLANLKNGRWLGERLRHDPRKPHWHFGPFAVDAQVQGRGIGSAMLGTFCARMDGKKALAYLETDKPENVRFYERFGFVTTSEALVLGTPNWFMQRQPRSG